MIEVNNKKSVDFSELHDGDGFFFPERNCHGIAVGRRPEYAKPHNAFLIYQNGEGGFWHMEHNDRVIHLGQPVITFNDKKAGK